MAIIQNSFTKKYEQKHSVIQIPLAPDPLKLLSILYEQNVCEGANGQDL